MQKNHYRLKTGVLLLLMAGNIFIWTSVAEAERPRFLTVAFLDVGQGDSIFIESPSGRQMLIDGGPDRSVLRGLGKFLRIYDRSVDVVMATHPDADHIGGLPDVLGNFTIGSMVTNGASSDTATFDAFERESGRESGALHVHARRGMIVALDEETRLSILFPDRDLSGADTNDASIVARLDYGETSFLLTGDASSAVEDYLTRIDSTTLDVDVLKVGHHGSNTSTSEFFVAAVTPMYAVISAGRDNRYGHPHPEVIDTLTKAGANILGTYDHGTIVFQSDGRRIWVR